MKIKLTLPTTLLLSVSLHLAAPIVAFAQGTAFTYQGHLNDGVNPAGGIYDLRFTIYDSADAGNVVAGPLTNSALAISNGFFTTTLNFGNVFPGTDRWLEIGVRTNGPGGFTTLSPRQKITATPYAITAGDVTSGDIARLDVSNTTVQATGHPIITSGFITSAVVDNGGSGYATAPNVVVNDATGSGAIITATVANGAVVSLTVNNAGVNYSAGATLTIGAPPSNAYQVFGSTNFFSGVNQVTNANNIFAGDGSALNGLWRLSGNPGTIAGTHFLGTTDNQALELRVNNQRALRLEPETQSQATIIAGSPFNNVSAGQVGATISGGGATNPLQTAYSIFSGLTVHIPAIPPAGSSNQIRSDFATIAGGVGNSIAFSSPNAVISGGIGNQIGTYAGSSVIAGGVLNQIQTSNSYLSVISGGISNLIGASADGNVIGGGRQNTIQAGAAASTISGGLLNAITGDSATIPGGERNSATNRAFAAGHRAKANHEGAFVWADAQNADFASTSSNQFLIRASGGVGIGTTIPVQRLTIGGTGGYNAPDAAAIVVTNSAAARAWEWHVFNDGRMQIADHTAGATRLIIETNGNVGIGTGATNKLHVAGGVSATAFVNTSDRNAKENFAPVSPEEILNKVATLPISTWNFKTMNDGRHMGPTAQDFHAAFGLGGGDTTITSVDPDGVALAAIQGLDQKLEDTRKENAELKQRLAALEKMILGKQPCEAHSP